MINETNKLLINFKISKEKKRKKMAQLDCKVHYMSACYVVRGVKIKKTIVKIANKKFLEIYNCLKQNWLSILRATVQNPN